MGEREREICRQSEMNGWRDGQRDRDREIGIHKSKKAFFLFFCKQDCAMKKKKKKDCSKVT